MELSRYVDYFNRRYNSSPDRYSIDQEMANAHNYYLREKARVLLGLRRVQNEGKLKDKDASIINDAIRLIEGGER